ncbi:MAG: hypothetical protein KC431_15620, partial [Myxococcales bacterium]|nr:hypothetical protein [Myxococcales bacterium]
MPIRASSRPGLPVLFSLAILGCPEPGDGGDDDVGSDGQTSSTDESGPGTDTDTGTETDSGTETDT